MKRLACVQSERKSREKQFLDDKWNIISPLLLLALLFNHGRKVAWPGVAQLHELHHALHVPIEPRLVPDEIRVKSS